MTDFTNLLAVAAAAFAAPLALGLVPGLRVPAVVLELVLGIVLGPDVLGWVEVDDAVRLMALLGLGFILLLAGLELDPDQLRGHRLRLSLLAFALSFAIAVVLALGLRAADLIESPLLVAIIASATSLGVVIPVLVDNGEAETPFGQLVLAACAVADVATIVLLSLFFSGEGSTSFGARLLLLAGFGLFVAAVGVAIRTLAAGLLQAVSLGFIVVGTELGMELGLLERSTGAAFVTAGLVSVIVFPLAATTLLRVTRVPRSATVPAR
jgi:Kef-type K+ transport system membrane component KefB